MIFMNEQIEKLTESCQEFINALYDTLEDMVDKILNTLEEVNWRKLVDEYIKAIKAESDSKSKKVQEQVSRKIFDMQMRHTKINKGHKIIQMNRKFAPRSWTGKNFKRTV